MSARSASASSGPAVIAWKSHTDHLRLRRTSIFIVAVAAAVIVALLPSPCRAQNLPTRAIALSADATDYEQAKLLQAVNEWNLALRGRAKVTALEKGTGAAADWRVIFVANLPHDSGCDANFITGTIRCRWGISSGQFLPILRHEIGHLLGLIHEAGTVMDPACCVSMQSIDEQSAARARATWGGIGSQFSTDPATADLRR